MAVMRESLMLPTVKCSSCGRQVEISLMGDHICSEMEEEEEVIRRPETIRSSFTSASLVLSPVSPPPELFAPFRPYDASITPERLGRIPPAVDIKAANEPWIRQGQLTPTSLIGESRTLSPPRTTDDFFTSSPSLEDDLIPSSRPIDFGSFSERRYGPAMENLSVSPVNTTLMTRMDKIAPGPFDTMRSPSTPAFPPRSASFDDRTMDFLSAPQDPMAPKRSATAPLQPITTFAPPSYSAFGAVPASPSMPKRMDYGGFGPPSASDDDLEPRPLGPIGRSETLPTSYSAYTEGPAPPRTPSAPGSRPFGHKSKPSLGPVTSRRPPPRTSLLQPQKNSGSVDIAAEFGIQNPYHTPSDSTSSGYSTFSHPGRTSSQTSPARSQTRPEVTESTEASNASNIGGLMSEVQNTMNSMRPKDLRIDPTLQPPENNYLPVLRTPFGESYDKSPGERIDPAIQNGLGFNTPLTPGLLGAYTDDEFSHDPAIQPGRPDEPPSESQDARKVSGTYRGDCKACGQAIRGKCVSSADGRLSGKYHKACFVCTTCSEPFTSAEFYVLEDKPYCEHHYHELNGSLCGACRKGIEGHYLEDEFQVKYHTGCFRCLDCGQSLSNGYFEVDGKSFCERDAWRRVQQPWLSGNGDHPSESDLFMRPPGPPEPQGPPRSPMEPPRTPMGPPGAFMEPPRTPMGPPGAFMEPPRTPMGPPGTFMEPPRTPMGPPGSYGNGRRPSYNMGPPGPPGRPGMGPGPGPRPPASPGMGPLRSPFGSPRRPGPALGHGPGAISAQRPRMNKRHTRLGMMA